MSLKLRVNNILAMGGDVAIPVLTVVNTASGVFPPLQAATNAALFILTEIKKFKGDKEEWERFGKCIADAMVHVIASIDSYDAFNDGVKPWMKSVTELSEALQRIQIEIDGLTMERRSRIRNFFSHIRNRSRIDDLKKDFSGALALFGLRTDLTVGAIANNLDRLTRGVEDSSVLNELKYPIIAHHDSAQACLKGTRTNWIQRIMAWCRNTDDSENRVFLLSGVAGAGKTSIALSIAEKCERERILSLGFFFKAGEQSWPDRLFSGMARSLATHDPAYRTSLISTLQENPALSTAPFAKQFQKLVAEPLLLTTSPSGRPMVIVIDALDECDTEALPCLADILRKEVPKLPPNIKFFVTSRQFDVVDRYLSLNYPIIRLTIDLSDDANMHDCAVYIQLQLRELKDVHPGLEDQIGDEGELVQSILERADGLFVWISTVFRYLKVSGGDPARILKKLLNAGVNRSKASAEEMMDRLYASILEKCDWKNDGFVYDYPIVMGAILIAQKPLSAVAWDAILSPFLNSSVRYTLAGLAPLISGVGNPGKPIRIMHQSFRRFLMGIDSQSPTLHRFRVDAKRENARVALRCIEILNKDLSTVKDLGQIGDFSQKARIPSIPRGVLSGHVHYACRYLVHHLNQAQEPLGAPNGSVHTFLNERITHWVEVCVRTGGYISISSFPEWVKLSVDRTSKEVIRMLVKVLGNVRGNFAFFSRLQEAYELANDSVALCRCLVSVESESYTPDLAEALQNLQASLDKLGWRSEALAAIEESVGLWRKLVAIHPASFTSELARALGYLNVSLDNLGRHPGALTVIKESVELWRGLVAIHPTLYTPDLARALGSLKGSLTKLGRYPEALTAIKESVGLWRELVAVDPTSHTPDLARALTFLQDSLGNLGRHSEALMVIRESVKLCRELFPEALTAIEESVNLWRKLVAVHPTSHTPGLARALGYLQGPLDRLGRHQEALVALEECVKLSRELVAVHPILHTPYLARALGYLKVSLEKLGRHSEALVMIKESVKLWRGLVNVHPTSYTMDLARALEILKVSLDKLKQRSEALTVIEESVKLWRGLVSMHPTSYTQDLARALRKLQVSLDGLGRHSEALLAHEERLRLLRQ
ncbi:uncharacterized protein EI90DRAFT_3119848 [Cantharellus anzutake]|uniref:uncharacterized protein n=1 Tax=Cantharellus anzutake TaxID=1750568 RepID=UPI001908F083|nr:uncharacterized protein EI90DRAFT_3119848 [Cantharellus anzutake]KAF8336603.1 hypothetical protein EI90DRAFT_3119848 [Cantharellus anzutake]